MRRAWVNDEALRSELGYFPQTQRMLGRLAVYTKLFADRELAQARASRREDSWVFPLRTRILKPGRVDRWVVLEPGGGYTGNPGGPASRMSGGQRRALIRVLSAEYGYTPKDQRRREGIQPLRKAVDQLPYLEG